VLREIATVGSKALTGVRVRILAISCHSQLPSDLWPNYPVQAGRLGPVPDTTQYS